MNTENMTGLSGSTCEESRKHLLLVDDDPLYLKMVRGWLEGKYTITAVKSGAQALAYLKAHVADLILLDSEMPEMNGLEVFERLKDDPGLSAIPVMFLTGKSEAEAKAMYSLTKQPPEGILSKALERDGIEAAIDAYFASHM